MWAILRNHSGKGSVGSLYIFIKHADRRDHQVSPKRPVVLIVEDEVLIRMAALDIVRNAGFEPIEAANADQAIAILEARNDIRIVFTDINMPGSMDGLKLAAAVRGRWPPIDFIVTSGHHAPTAGDLPERGLFIRKPYSNFQVARALAELTAS
jgi:DNA-binding NtrC family response regulator